MKLNTSIYCYETKERFDSRAAAARKYNLSSGSDIGRVVNNPTKRIAGYHWCTDLSIFNDVILSTNKKGCVVFCYETKDKFDSYKEAAAFVSRSCSRIKQILDDPTKTINGYHFCTSLEKFDNITLSGYESSVYKSVYCYETKDMFKSISEACKKYPKCVNISGVLDKPYLTTGNYHWCTSLNVFDNIELSNLGSKIIYCYETKERFESIKEASQKYNITGFYNVLDNPNRTLSEYHWCTALSIFDGVKLTNPIRSGSKVIFCYETKERFNSISEAGNKYNKKFSIMSSVINDSKFTIAGYHWCTSLDVFDGVDFAQYNRGFSTAEKNLVGFIKSIYTGEIVENTRSVISPKELDIYLPELKIAIEFNGNYWHSDKVLKQHNKHVDTYHIDKTNKCTTNSIQLIHIFEHQWNNKPEIIKSLIRNKLGLNTNKIYARKCEVREVSSKDASKFLDENHMQGSTNAKIKLGLYYKDVLVSLMTLSKPRNYNTARQYEYELVRFCNKLNTSVIGGASKLLKYFERAYTPISIMSYANLQWSVGKLYETLGFDYSHTSDPNYWWTKGNNILTRYQCQPDKLSNLFKLNLITVYDSNMTESAIMRINGYSKLYDCGNLVYNKSY